MFESVDYLKTMPVGVLIAIILGLGFILNGYWKDRKRGLDKRDKALEENTRAIIKLEIQIERLTDLLTIVPKLKADIDIAHEKIRDLQNSL